jgi:hypothetical protein
MSHRDQYQRQAYAMRRMSKAVDRAILAGDPVRKASAARWAALWRRRAGLDHLAA